MAHAYCFFPLLHRPPFQGRGSDNISDKREGALSNPILSTSIPSKLSPTTPPPSSSTSFTSPISFPPPNHPSHLLLHISPVPTLATSLTSLSHSLPTYIHTITQTQKLQTHSKKLSDRSFTHSFIRSFYAQHSTFIPPLPSFPFPSP